MVEGEEDENVINVPEDNYVYFIFFIIMRGILFDLFIFI